jgi:uncharacterized NAD(P)/FAD-binding protein YdhS
MEAFEHLHGQGVLRVTLRQPQGKRTLDVARIVNCTGPQADPSRTANPLLQSLTGDGVARTDSIGLGLATDERSRVIGADCAVRDNLFALGALSRGSKFETTAIPEIAEQVDAIAREILQRISEAARPTTHNISTSLLGSAQSTPTIMASFTAHSSATPVFAAAAPR